MLFSGNLRFKSPVFNLEIVAGYSEKLVFIPSPYGIFQKTQMLRNVLLGLPIAGTSAMRPLLHGVLTLKGYESTTLSHRVIEKLMEHKTDTQHRLMRACRDPGFHPSRSSGYIHNAENAAINF